MKNRRNIIVAFLLCACLLVGIGYAQVTGNLAISGTARFNGSDKLTNDVNSAVKFVDSQPGKNCDSATISGEDYGQMTVVINDAVGTPNKQFTAEATYTIGYDTTDITFPEVKLSAVSSAMRPVEGVANDQMDKWNITAVYQNPSEGATINTDDTVTLAPGATVEVLITITFTNGEGETLFKGANTAAISVGMPYATITEN